MIELLKESEKNKYGCNCENSCSKNYCVCKKQNKNCSEDCGCPEDCMNME